MSKFPMAKSSTAKSSAAKFQAPPFAEFLNPNAMITPGAAGAFTMVITNALCSQFNNLPPNYAALAISGLFGAMVFQYGAVRSARILYFVVNSLIIFVVANGSNSLGSKIEDHYAAPVPAKTAAQLTLPSQNNFSIASADKGTDQQDKQNQQSKKPRFFRQW